MSLWDIIDSSPETETTKSLIEGGNSSLESVLKCTDLISTFRSQEDYLIQ